MGNPPAFVNEESLTQLFASLVWDAIPRKNGCKHPLVMREVDCNRGRADIVCAVSRDNNFDFHKASHLGIALSELTKACILSWLNKSSLRTETYIQEMTGLGQKTIRKHLRGLIEAGLVDGVSTFDALLKDMADGVSVRNSTTLSAGDADVEPKPKGNDTEAIYQAVVDASLSQNIHSAKNALDKCKTGYSDLGMAIAWMTLYRGWRDMGEKVAQAAKQANNGEVPK